VAKKIVMEPLTDAQIEVMERVRERLLGRGFAMTDAEIISYAVIYRRLRNGWAEIEQQGKPHPMEIFVLFAQEEGFGE
jgi:hypothetical protein